jgi:hypothetical protein
MLYEKKKPRWRDWMTQDERARMAKIDALESQWIPARDERQLIANRALQRARYADRNTGEKT